MAAMFMARWTFSANSSDPWMNDAIEAIKPWLSADARVYSPYFGDTNHLIVETDHESLDAYEKAMNALGEKVKANMEGWRKGNSLAKIAKTELFWKRKV